MAGLAAGIVAAVTVWAAFRQDVAVTPDALALAVVTHVDHEPESLARTDVAVTAERLAAVLAGRAVLDLMATETVTYARICNIGGKRVPHLVIQGQDGPYMVVLLPDRMLERAVPLELPAQALAGHLMPAGGGSIAVLGAATTALDEMEARIRSAVSWEI